MTMCSVSEEEALDLIEKARTALVKQTTVKVRAEVQHSDDMDETEEAAE